MELFIFGRFVSKSGQDNVVGDALRDVLAETRKEAGCIAVSICQSESDPNEFRIFSHWRDSAAFDLHSTLPHVVAFSEKVEPLIDDSGLVRTKAVDA